MASHNMDECEALCTRIGILVNGAFACLGPGQHLKNKFCKGFTIIIKYKKYDATYEEVYLKEISDFIMSHFPTASITEIYRNIITFILPDTKVPWSRLFGIMEKGRKELIILEDYSLSQCTLEQVALFSYLNIKILSIIIFRYFCNLLRFREGHQYTVQTRSR